MSSPAGFLQVFDLVLTTQTPLFIGDGKTILKKSYLYDKRTNQVSIFDEEKFFSLLLEKDLVDSFESFMLGSFDNLFTFLTQDCHLTESDWKSAVRYTFDAGAALDAHHTLSDIHAFIRDAAGCVYVPGSSVKGALRTILLHQMICEEGVEHTQLEPDRRIRCGVIPEGKYLHTLKLKQNRQDDMVNSILRGIQVSDSMPISDEYMVLADKWDSQTNGSLKKVPVCRESIRPGTPIYLKLTLDQSILQRRITQQSLMQAIDDFNRYYQETYLRQFSEPKDTADIPFQSCLFLGGGSGFFAKSLVYPYLGKKRGLKKTAEIMQSNFKFHHHDRDEALGISPHTLKYTKYQGKYYLMGLCGVEIR